MKVGTVGSICRSSVPACGVNATEYGPLALLPRAVPGSCRLLDHILKEESDFRAVVNAAATRFESQIWCTRLHGESCWTDSPTGSTMSLPSM